MIRWALLAVVAYALLFASPSQSAPLCNGWRSSCEIRANTCTAKTIQTKPFAWNAALYVRVFANGHKLDLTRAEQRWGQWQGHGAAVTLQAYYRTGPLQIRLANMRFSGCSRFRIVLQVIAPEPKP